MNIFIICAAIALILLIIQFIRQVHRVKKGDPKISRGAIFFNWLLLLVFLVGTGGAIFTGISTHRQAAKPSQPVKAVSNSTSSQTDQAIKLDFTSDVTMASNDQVNIKITVSRGTTVTVKGRNTGHTYQSFKVARGRGTTTKVIHLDSAGPYQVIAKRNGKKVAKNLTVRQAMATTTSSASAVSQSSVSQAVSVNNTQTTSTSSAIQGRSNPAITTSGPATTTTNTNTSSQANNQ